MRKIAKGFCFLKKNFSKVCVSKSEEKYMYSMNNEHRKLGLCIKVSQVTKSLTVEASKSEGMRVEEMWIRSISELVLKGVVSLERVSEGDLVCRYDRPLFLLVFFLFGGALFWMVFWPQFRYPPLFKLNIHEVAIVFAVSARKCEKRIGVKHIC